MRYDTMLATAMSIDAVDAGGRVAQWRQLVDLVVQAKGTITAALRDAVFERIAALRGSVPVEERRSAARQLAARTFDGDGVALFGIDEPTVAAPVLSVAKLDPVAWQLLIPQMPPASRALLRNRRDLPDDTVRALASYGLSDFGLPANGAPGDDAGTQIRDLVARIESFRRGNPVLGAALPTKPDQASEFAFETSIDGAIDWVAGAPREALIGQSIAQIADDGGVGVDGQAAGAFRRRAPFRDARLAVAGTGSSSGAWLISAAPVFNPRDGRFAGYHGEARRPRADDVAGPVALFSGTSLPNDALRQLVHELKTPLNAILGFAEMIELQLLGPAAQAYRDKARDILEDGQRLLELVDDLDEAGRVGRGAAPIITEEVDPGALLARIVAQFESVVVARQTPLQIGETADVQPLSIDASALERIMKRLIGAALGLAQAGESISVSLHETRDGQVEFSVQRPSALNEVANAALLDPAYDFGMPYPDAPLLGLGFSLRLIGALARDVGGRFAIMQDCFVVTLPGEGVRADLPAVTP